jgi:hypothetical protein
MEKDEVKLMMEKQVHRICFALALFHFILSGALVGVKDTKDKRASIQNGYISPSRQLFNDG